MYRISVLCWLLAALSVPSLAGWSGEVVVGNEVVMRIRSNAGGIRPRHRAEKITQSISNLLGMKRFHSNLLKVEKVHDQYCVMYLGEKIVTVDKNTARENGCTPEELANTWANNLKRVMPQAHSTKLQAKPGDIIIGNEVVMRIRAPIGGFSIEERVNIIKERINEYLLGLEPFNPERLIIEVLRDGTHCIRYGASPTVLALIVAVDDETALINGCTAERLAGIWRRRLRKVIPEIKVSGRIDSCPEDVNDGEGPTADEAPGTFRLQAGDEATYMGRGTELRRWEDGTRSVSYSVKLVTLALGQDQPGLWRIGQFWHVQFDEDTSQRARGLAPFRTQTALSSAAPDDPGWCSWAQRMGPQRYMPVAPRGELQVGQTWDVPVLVSLTAEAPMRCQVAGEESVGGRPCLRIDVTPAEALPCALKDNTMYEGGPPPKLTLTAFDGHLWVAKDNGWVVRYEQASKVLKSDDSGELFGMPLESEHSLTLSLQTARRVVGVDFEKLADQLARMRNIRAHMRSGPPHYNAFEGAGIAMQEIEEFRRVHPDSPYAPALARLEEMARKHRERGEQPDRPDRPGHPMLGKVAPQFVGETTDGRTVTPADLRGKPAVLFFMNIGMKFCDHSAPKLESFKQQWESKGVQFVGVSMFGGGTKQFKDRHALTFPLLAPTSPLGEPEARDVSLFYRMHVDLGVVVLDADGYIRYYRWGFYPTELGQFLNKMLAK